MTPLTVRVAHAADAAALSAFAARTFVDTFAAHNTPEDLARHLADSFTPARQAAEIADPRGVVLLVENVDTGDTSTLAGYAYLVAGPTPTVVTGPSPLELKRLYVSREWHGRGVAHVLMEAIFQTAAARGARTLWLGVWERNPRAVVFYRKYGFVRVGEHTFLLGTDPQTDWLLVRPIEGLPSEAPELA